MFPFNMRSISYQIGQPTFQKERDGFYGLSLSNIPAFTEEPEMPTEEKVRPWMLVYYAEDNNTPPEKYWPRQSEALFNSYKGQTKPNDAIRKAATGAMGAETTPQGKLLKLYDYVRREIRNIQRDPSFTSEQRSAFKDNNSAADTFKQKAGTGLDIALLYIALSNALQMDVRLARTAPNNDAVFSKAFTSPYFLRGLVLAAKLPSGWRFFDPMVPGLTFGMLATMEEGAPALIGDPKGIDLAQAPISGPEQTQTKRTARFKLAADGSLEGAVTVEYTGHENAWRKEAFAGKTPEEIVEETKGALQKRWPDGEISGLAVTNAKDLNGPITISYNLKTRGYAERTGRRMFVRPSFFHWNHKPRFTQSERKHAVQFEHAWSEVDNVTFELPVGFSLDNARSPGSFALGPIGDYKTELRYDSKNSQLLYKRELSFGKSGLLTFPVAGYPHLKNAFQLIQEQDDHAIALRPNALPPQ